MSSYLFLGNVFRFVARSRRGNLAAGGLSLFLVFVLASCGGASSGVAEPPAEPTVGLSAEAEPTVKVEPTAEAGSAPSASVTVAPVTPEPDPEPTPAPTAVVVPVVFADDFGTSIAPVFASKCASCHNAEGPGATHWRLEEAGDVASTSEWISSVIDSGYMPPWPAGDLSPTFHENRSLRADERQAISDWVAAGAVLDVAESTPIVAPNGAERLIGDIEIAPPAPYVGATELADDYRCMIYDLGVTEEVWMQGYEFVPDQTHIVHHAVGYLLSGAAMDQALARDAQDDNGGWQCYGGTGLAANSDFFLGWAPGQLPTRYPEDTGVRVQPGDFVVVQIHYHIDTPRPPDSSTLRIDWADSAEVDELDPIEFAQLLAPAEIPCSSDESGPLCDRDAAIARARQQYGVEGVLADNINSICGVTPADFADMTDGIASASCEQLVLTESEIVSVFGHEHEIGKSFRMTLNAGQPDEQILLDIPEWSFDWQYNYYPTDSIKLKRGDRISIECTWDRSLRSPDLEPAYVVWADGTNDEMCFGTIATRTTGGHAS